MERSLKSFDYTNVSNYLKEYSMLHIEKFEVNMLQENCYVVSDETRECVIIDCGAFYPEERTAIVNYIKENNFQLVHLLVTHGHLDHNFGNNTIHETFGLKPEVSAADESLMKNLKQQAEVFYQMQLDYDFPPVGHFFEENEVIHFGNHQFEIILTPGHSRGSVTFYCAEEKVAFTGDTLFRGSIGRTDFKGGSMFQIINSLRFLAQLPDDVKVLPGHGQATSIGEELAHNPYMDR